MPKMATRHGERSIAASRWGLVTLVMGVVAVAALAVGIVKLSREERDAARDIEHTLTVVEGIASLQAHFQQGVSEGRGYFLSGLASDRARSDAAFARVGPDVSSLRLLMLGHPAHLQTLDQLERMMTERIASLRATMELPYGGRSENPAVQARRRFAQTVMANVITMLETMTAEERLLLARRQAVAARDSQWLTGVLVLLGMIAAGSAFAMVAMAIVRGRERRHLAEVSRLKVSLEAQVVERTADLAHSEARHRGYFDNSPIGVYVLRVRADGEVEHEDVNPAFAALFGFAPDEMIGRTIRELWPDAFARDVEQWMDDCLAGGSVVHATVSRHLRGQMRVFDMTRVPLPGGTEETRRMLGCVRDVSEQHELVRQVKEHAAREAETAELARVLLNDSPDIVCIMRVDGDADDPAFVYEACGPAIVSFTGLGPEAVVGRRTSELLPPGIAEKVEQRLRRCVRDRNTIAFTRKTARGRDLEGSVTPVKDPATGRINRIVALARDVTERNRTEEALRHAQKREALGRLTSGVAHDVNNVLAVISNGYDTIELATDNPVLRDCVATGRSAVEHAAGLVRHLLAFARQHPVAPAVVNTATALGEIAALCRHAVGRGITLTLDAPMDLWPIRVEENSLQAAVLNLVTNARDAMPRGGAITIAARNVAASGDAGETMGVDCIAIAIRDTGSGMPPEVVARATEPFFTTKPPGAGSGLGLATVDGFVAQSQGRLRIDSSAEHGTEVTMMLPRAALTAPISRSDQDAPRAAHDAPARTVLLVDDNQALLRATSLLLRTLGYTVITASNYAMALEMIDGHPEIDLVLTDITMAGGSGILLADRLEVLRPSLPIVFATGFASDEHLTHGRQVLRKPFAAADMLRAFDTALQDPGPRATADAPC